MTEAKAADASKLQVTTSTEVLETVKLLYQLWMHENGILNQKLAM
jgi:hypothetical protein